MTITLFITAAFVVVANTYSPCNCACCETTVLDAHQPYACGLVSPGDKRAHGHFATDIQCGEFCLQGKREKQVDWEEFCYK